MKSKIKKNNFKRFKFAETDRQIGDAPPDGRLRRHGALSEREAQSQKLCRGQFLSFF